MSYRDSLRDIKNSLVNWGIDEVKIDDTLEWIEKAETIAEPQERWEHYKNKLSNQLSFEFHKFCYDHSFANWDESENGPPPVWVPSKDTENSTNIHRWMQKKGKKNYQELFLWAHKNREEFWSSIVNELQIEFDTPTSKVLDESKGSENAQWYPNARMNIANSCFLADPNKTAIVYQDREGDLNKLTYKELNELSNRVANSLDAIGIAPGDAVAIDMIMTMEAVAIYLGIVKAGCVVVSIADSFAAEEIATRLRISNAKLVFTQDVLKRGNKSLPLYEKVTKAGAQRAIVLNTGEQTQCPLRDGDLLWESFLKSDTSYEAKTCDASDTTNILFSSGTTGDPKAIPWTHLTPIKCASDAYFHQDVKKEDVVAWPTNLGWMMGPWLIYAALLNQATIALYYDPPLDRSFGDFIEKARVSVLGLVPSMVKLWKKTNCMQGVDWRSIKVFSSTGECSNAEDYLFLMSLASYQPVIEYCGGTEIGGGYISGTLVQSASPGTFTSIALGLNVEILNENSENSKTGEVFIVPPSIGLSTSLLNRDHSEVYFKDTPLSQSGGVLRRHGDEIETLPGGYFRGLGRADDTMNLGGIKTSSAEIERSVNSIEGVVETAAIAISPKNGGPSELVVYFVWDGSYKLELETLKTAMQKQIKTKLNPLFKIEEIIEIDKLPRTASNKVMRRVLRSQFHNKLDIG